MVSSFEFSQRSLSIQEFFHCSELLSREKIISLTFGAPTFSNAHFLIDANEWHEISSASQLHFDNKISYRLKIISRIFFSSLSFIPLFLSFSLSFLFLFHSLLEAEDPYFDGKNNLKINLQLIHSIRIETIYSSP